MSLRVSSVSAPTFTRPNDTTAYTAADLVANNTTAGSVTPLLFTIPNRSSCIIRGVRIVKSTTATTNATFTLHLYETSPTVANGDNGALSTSNVGKIGSVACSTMTAYSANGAFTVNSSPTLYVDTTDQKIYGLLEAAAAYTPGAQETFTVTLVIEQ